MVGRAFLLTFVATIGVFGASVSRGADAPVDFTRDIRPLLSDRCFACHGHDAKQRKSDLRLDLPDTAVRPAKSGKHAIVPGKPQASELLARVTSTDPEERMPPGKTNKKPLLPEQVELFRRWIAEGAHYQTHWAFVAPVRPELPAVRNAQWARTPIDRFVLAKLETEGLPPSPETDKLTLLRRLHLDLTGLPPTIQEIDAYLNDAAPDAYQKVVESLLASPHYGERWGRHWLDAARYADTDGYEKDKFRRMSFYRDYVIGAFNRDLPYDQFLTEQLAGDELPHPTQDQLVATGFLRNSMINEEGGVDPEQFRMDAMFDRMDAVGKGILGLTIQCAQCHSHKYDPLTQEEYYRLFAFLNNDHEAQNVVYTPAEQMKVADLTRQMREIEAALRGQTPDWSEQMAKWEASVATNQPQWTVLPVENTDDGDQRYFPRADGSLLAQGYAPTKFTAHFKAKTPLNGITAFRLELLTDPNLPAAGPGRSFKGTCALTQFTVETALAGDEKKKTPVKFTGASADFDQPERELEPNFYDKSANRRVTGGVKLALDDDEKSAWGIDAGPGRRNQDRKAVFQCERPIAAADANGETTLLISLQQKHGGWNSDDLMNNNLGRFRLSATTAPGSVMADPLPRRVRDILGIPHEKRTDSQTAEVFTYWRTTVPQWKEANDRIEALWQQWPAGATSLTLIARDQPRDTHLLMRGDWLKPAQPVMAGVPEFLNQLPPGHDATRLTFARWISDKNAPTTARVFVNRIWQAYFGTGIVATSEDFGVQSDAPSHRDLLDWLACEFMHPSQEGAPDWSIKHIHRLIVNSTTYRQSSRISQELYARDPNNRLLARGARFRVEGEIVRDIALSTSGLLNTEMDGRSIMPPAPAFLFQPPASYAPFPWIEEAGAEKYRRSVYVLRRRSTPYPVLQTFDAPNADASCVRRSRSNSPLQALVSLNEPVFVDCARALARKTLTEGGATDEQRVAFAFRQVLSRMPKDAERRELLDLLAKEQKRFAEGFLNPSEVATGKPAVVNDLPPHVTPTQLGCYTVVCRVLLNLDEAITKE